MANEPVLLAAEVTYKAISDYVNGYKHYTNAVADEMMRDHKLLQTYVVDLFITCIDRMANVSEDRITVQNRTAVEKCRAMMQGLDARVRGG